MFQDGIRSERYEPGCVDRSVPCRGHLRSCGLLRGVDCLLGRRCVRFRPAVSHGGEDDGGEVDCEGGGQYKTRQNRGRDGSIDTEGIELGRCQQLQWLREYATRARRLRNKRELFTPRPPRQTTRIVVP